MSGADVFIDVRGARLRLRVEGGGPAVLLMHGWALDLDVWQPQFEQMSRSHLVVAFDRRGFGLSSGDPSIQHDVQDAVAVLDRLELDRVAVVASSQGARVALRLALTAPARVAGLVLDSPTDEVHDRTESLTAQEIPLAQYRALAQQGDLAAVRAAWASHPLTQLTTSDAALKARLGEITARYPGRDLLLNVESPPALGEQLAQIRQRALILNGAEDSRTRIAAGVLLASTLPRAEHVLIAGAGHLPNLDRPRAYHDIVEPFCKESLDAKD